MFSSPLKELHPAVQILILFCFAFGIGAFLSALILSIGAIALHIGSDQESLMDALQTNPDLLRLVQIGASLGMFILPSLAFSKFYDREKSLLEPTQNTNSQQIAFNIGWLLVAFPIMFGLMHFNQMLDLPENLKFIEDWIREKESQTELAIELLLSDTSIVALILNLGIIAILPAIGEELLFRGVLQPILIRWVNNKHLGIWLGAIIFSAMHFQFLGFLPRMFIGLLLGYAYAWSGNLLVPMFMHFTNNGLTVLVEWLYRTKSISVNEDALSNLPWWIYILSFIPFYFVGKKVHQLKVANP